MSALAAFGAMNYRLLLRKPPAALLAETTAVETTKKNLPPNADFVHTSKVELLPGNPKLLGSLAVWHVQVQVRRPVPQPGQPPVSDLFDYYIDAMTGRGTT